MNALTLAIAVRDGMGSVSSIHVVLNGAWFLDRLCSLIRVIGSAPAAPDLPARMAAKIRDLRAGLARALHPFRAAL